MPRYKTFTKDELLEKTNAELRELCKQRKIPGMSKKRKDVIVDAIMMYQDGTPASEGKKTTTTITKKDDNNGEPTTPKGDLTAATFTLSSVLTKPSAKKGDKTTTTIRVSSGAATGEFPVTGRNVSEVKSFLKEVFNISKMASPIVNGNQVDDNYVIKEGDEVEFLKPAGQKG